MMTDTHIRTHTHIHAYPWSCVRTNTHTSRGASFIALPGALHDTHTHTHTHTHTSSYELEICLTMTHTYTHSDPRLVALQNTYFSSTFTEAFLFHACGVTRNWRTYFIRVRRVFLVETVVLQTVLWDIRAWSARFLVNDSSTLVDSLTYSLPQIVVELKIKLLYIYFPGVQRTSQPRHLIYAP